MTGRPRLVFRGPVLTASGYGMHARQLLKALRDSGKFALFVESTRWGETSFLHGDELEWIRKLAAAYEEEVHAGRSKYDLSVQVTIPNEYRKLASLNIGVTAGIEVDRVAPEWIVKANTEIDLLIVPSRHSANVYRGTTYKGNDGSTLALTCPVEVIPEGAEFVGSAEPDTVLPDDLPPFNFLHVGLGLDKTFGEDRKNIGNLVKWFCEVFGGDRGVGLVLKSSIVNNSLIDFSVISKRISEIKASVGCGEFPRVTLVHGRLTDRQMASLYRDPRVKVFVTLTHGEGFGLPVLEAAAAALPVIAPDWSGHVDFLKSGEKKLFVSVDHDLVEIPQSAIWDGVMPRGSRWASVREDDVKLKLRKVVLSYDTPKKWADELAPLVREKFSLENTGREFCDLVTRAWERYRNSNPRTQDEVVSIVSREMGISPREKTLLYTMPMSAGDVYLSTATVDSLKKKYPDHRIFFATEQRYASILEGNSDIDVIVQWQPWMANVALVEKIFTQVYTPNLAIQLNTSNWIRGGHGRSLAAEIASQCGVEPGEYKISEVDPGVKLPESYVVFHPGSGKGQWEARNYLSWQEVVTNLVDIGVKVVQVGTKDERPYKGVIDLRGRTGDYRQLAYVVRRAAAMFGIDSVVMHLAAGSHVPVVALFGSSYAASTGPDTRLRSGSRLTTLLEPPTRRTCDKACYKYECAVDRGFPCINDIEPRKVFNGVLDIVGDGLPVEWEYKRVEPKISGYIHVLDAESRGFPYIQSIRSMLGFCDEVVVVDGGSTDGTFEKIVEIGDDRIKLQVREWDWSEPGMDGMQKAYARALCTGEFLWQQDADEVVHEADYEKIKLLVKRFPTEVDLLHLPVVELWGSRDRVRTDRHSWKWRLSRDNFKITHGIVRHARVLDEKTGKVYAKRGMSDGCEYVDIMTNEYIPHAGFWTPELERLRKADPQAYGHEMNLIFEKLPSVFHYSWCDLPTKVENFKNFWDKCWANLYNDPAPVPRFPADETVGETVARLEAQGGEHGLAETFDLAVTNPASMVGWPS